MSQHGRYEPAKKSDDPFTFKKEGTKTVCCGEQIRLGKRMAPEQAKSAKPADVGHKSTESFGMQKQERRALEWGEPRQSGSENERRKKQRVWGER